MKIVQGPVGELGEWLEAHVTAHSLTLKHSDGRQWEYTLPNDVPPINDGNTGYGLGPYPYLRLNSELNGDRDSEVCIYWIEGGPVITRWTMWKTFYHPQTKAYVLWDHRQKSVTLTVVIG